MGDDQTDTDQDAFEPARLSELLVGYEVQELVAVGGMGAVFRADQLSLGRQVAIKVLPEEVAADEAFLKSFEAEARAMAKLAHPNLIGVYDFGQVEGLFYLVMEFVDGGSLYEACLDQAVDPQQAVEIVRAVASGLGAAHENGIIHRDIKPANILMGSDLVPKLGDFGLAVPSDDVASGLVMGTPGFVAPEVLADPEAASPASDVFALGAMLHQLLTGLTPDGEVPVDVNLVPMTHGLRQLVQRAVASEPAARFAVAGEMAEALQQWLDRVKNSGGLLQTGGAPATPRAVPMVTSTYAGTTGSSGGGGGLLAAGLVALLAVAGVAVYLSGGGKEEKVEVDPPPPALVPDPAPIPPPAGKDDEPVVMTEESSPPPVVTVDVEAINARYVTALREAREEMVGRRLENGGGLRQAVEGRSHWEAYLELVDEEHGLLPAVVMEEEGVTFLPDDQALLEEHLLERQASIDREHAVAVKQLHRDWVLEMREKKVEVSRELVGTWELWAESLGLAPLDLLGQRLAGEWRRVVPADEGVAVVINNRHEAIIVRKDLEIRGENLLSVSRDGEITVICDPADRSRSWNLRWREGVLVGVDEGGEPCELVRQSFDLLAMVGEDDETGGEDGGMKPQVFEDPELMALHLRYLDAVQTKIEPLCEGYSKVLQGAVAKAGQRSDERSLNQLLAELQRVDALPWRSGCVILSEVDWSSLVPLSQQGFKSTFDRTFKERMGGLQNTYISQLDKLRRKYEVSGKSTFEVKREMARFTTPPGTARVRYVKLQAEKAPGAAHVALAEINILNREGSPLPQERFKIHGVSSAQVLEGDAKDRPAEHAIDGQRWTLWHSRWKHPRPEWPHWIAIDLQEEQLIGGFRVLPRQEWMREGDLVSWSLFGSTDGRDWFEIAKGEFPRAKQMQEFRLGVD